MYWYSPTFATFGFHNVLAYGEIGCFENNLLLPQCLDAFAKLGKATNSFGMFVCPSVCSNREIMLQINIIY